MEVYIILQTKTFPPVFFLWILSKTISEFYYSFSSLHCNDSECFDQFLILAMNFYQPKNIFLHLKLCQEVYIYIYILIANVIRYIEQFTDKRNNAFYKSICRIAHESLLRTLYLLWFIFKEYYFVMSVFFQLFFSLKLLFYVSTNFHN